MTTQQKRRSKTRRTHLSNHRYQESCSKITLCVVEVNYSFNRLCDCNGQTCVFQIRIVCGNVVLDPRRQFDPRLSGFRKSNYRLSALKRKPNFHGRSPRTVSPHVDQHHITGQDIITILLDNFNIRSIHHAPIISEHGVVTDNVGEQRLGLFSPVLAFGVSAVGHTTSQIDTCDGVHIKTVACHQRQGWASNEPKPLYRIPCDIRLPTNHWVQTQS
jgi:hypothetical protein